MLAGASYKYGGQKYLSNSLAWTYAWSTFNPYLITTMIHQTEAQSIATRIYRAAESARRVLRARACREARAADAQEASGRELTTDMILAVGKAAIDAERAERAVLIARQRYFALHPNA